MSAGGSQWERVPAELKVLDRWVCWKLVQVKDGRWTKVPVCAATGREASSTDSATWCGFDAAVAAVGRHGTKGIGLVFAPDRAYTGLDLDHVLHDGALDPEYQWVVDEADTYTEVSPSGDGLHLYFRGSKPADGRCRRGNVEMYDHARFFTVTGVPFGKSRPVAARPNVLEKAYRTWLEPVSERAQPTLADALNAPGADSPGSQLACSGAGNGSDACEIDDAELVRRMRASRSGAEIAALLGGDMSAQGGDHSAADLALCNHLAFWCGGDAVRMDRIFRSSGLMRNKWDSRRGGTTYGAQTIERAVSEAREFYAPKVKRRDASRRGGSHGGGSRKAGNALAKNTDKCSTNTPRGSVKGVSDGSDAAAPDVAEMPTGDAAPSIERWRVDAKGGLWTRSADGEFDRPVSRTAPWVACDLIDVDDNEVRSLVRAKVGGKVVERSFDRGVLLSQNRIVTALAPMGVNISTANAKDIVCYLTDCDRRLGDLWPKRASVRHLGWAKDPLGAFMPYDADDPETGDVHFDASADQLAKARPFMEPRGTLADWVAGVAPARSESMAFRCVMAASFASPLVALLDVQTFIVYLWGRSRSGKTPTLKAAGSVWGDPTEGTDSYFRTFADTPKSITRAAALLHDIPIIIDELQSKGSSAGGQAGKRMAVEDLLYSLSIGHERSALNSDRTMMKSGSWKSLTIATGEIPIVGDSTQQGAANRTLELNAEPFGDVRAAQAMHRHVAACHGTAGRVFIDVVRRNGPAFLREWFSAIRDAVAAIACGHPQADNVALITLADAIAEHYVFSPGREWNDCVASAMELAAWALGASTGLSAADTDLKAMQFVSEWLVGHRACFDDRDRPEFYGITEARSPLKGSGGTVWCVFSNVLEKALRDVGYDRQKTLRRMADEGVLELTGSCNGFTKQKRIDGERIYCVCIDQVALEAVLERPTDAAAVFASCSEKPC